MKFEFSLDYLQFLTTEYLVPFGIKLITALVVFLIGRAIARFLRRALERVTEGRLERGLQRFICSMVYAFMLTVVVIISLERVGIETTAAIAVLGAAGLAVGLALQGSLANFAAGVMVIIFKPFKVGDFVEIGGVAGTVEKIDIFTTLLITPDNRSVIMPNGQATNGNIINLSAKGTRRIDLEIGVSYGDDLGKAKKVIEDVLAADPRVLKEPAPTVAVSNLNSSSVDFVVRPWCKFEDYWALRFDVLRKVKEQLDANGVTIPFPQQDVWVKQLPKAS